MTNAISEIPGTDCLLVVGSNTTEAHPLIARRMFQAKERGALLIVVDPRKIQLTHRADIHVQLRFGSDIAFFNGVMHEILDRGWENREFITSRCEDFEEFKENIMAYPVCRAAELSGVPEDTIRAVAKAYATADKAAICYTLGITEHAHGVDNVKTLGNMAMITGHIGRPNTGVNPLRGQNNVQGACDMGALPNVYPGYQPVTDEAVRKKFEEAWQRPLSADLGKTIPDVMDGLMDGSVKGLYIFGENSVEGDPNTAHVKKALNRCEFLVVQDIFLTATAQMADVVLPGACYAEVDGTFTNSERRVQRVRKAVEPPGEARPNWQIFADLGRRMGLGMAYRNSGEIYDEMAALSPSFAGISFGRIETLGLQWPCPEPDHPGTPFLHQGRFTRGLGKFHAIPHREPRDGPDEAFPIILTTGRRYAHYNTSTMTGRCPSLDREMYEPRAQINVADAEALGIADGDMVRITSRRGRVVTAAEVGDVVPRGAVFMDFHFVAANSNELLGTFLDPVSKTPDYKVCAVSIEKVDAEASKDNAA